MKKKIILFALLCICASMLASGTLAYFTAEDTAHNVITTGGVDIRLDEWQDTGAGLVPYPEEPARVMPGDAVSKVAEVANLAAESYIRAKISVVFYDADGNVMQLDADTLAGLLHIAVNGEDWLQKDGEPDWYYYSTSVLTSETTAPLFTEVVFDGPNMTNEYQNCTVEILVVAQAVQSANNGANVFEATGWPAD